MLPRLMVGFATSPGPCCVLRALWPLSDGQCVFAFYINRLLMCFESAGGFSVFAGVGERTREGNDLYKEMTESVSLCHAN